MTTPTITTAATAQCEKMPDLATVKVTTVGEGEAVPEARTTARDRTAMIRESVSAVAAEQIQTLDIEVENTDEMFDPVTDAAYQVTERLHIECVPETAEDVVMEVTDAGGCIQTVQFYLHEETHHELQDEALAGAVERARKKAESMAAAEGCDVAGVQEVTTKEMRTGMESVVDEALASDSNTDLYPKQVTISESVEVTYELQQ